MRIFFRILFVSALAAAGFAIYSNHQITAHRSSLEQRLDNLESRLAQEVAIRQALLKEKQGSGPRAGQPAKTSQTRKSQETESRDWARELDEKDRQIRYLRSVIEKLALHPDAQPDRSQPAVVPAPTFVSAPGSPQAMIEEMPPSAVSVKNPVNQVMGEVTQINPDNHYMFINRGERHGVTEGMVFEVYRKGRIVGHVRAGSVYDAVTSVQSPDGFGAFQKGDMVRSSSSN